MSGRCGDERTISRALSLALWASGDGVVHDLNITDAMFRIAAALERIAKVAESEDGRQNL